MLPSLQRDAVLRLLRKRRQVATRSSLAVAEDVRDVHGAQSSVCSRPTRVERD